MSEKYFQLPIYNEQNWREWQIIRSISRLTFLVVSVASVLGYWQMSISPQWRKCSVLITFNMFFSIGGHVSLMSLSIIYQIQGSCWKICFCKLKMFSIKSKFCFKNVSYVCQHKIEMISSLFIKHLYFVVFLFKKKLSDILFSLQR